MRRIIFVAWILFVLTVAPTTAVGPCRNLEAVDVLLNPCVTLTAVKWTAQLQHVVVDFLPAAVMGWVMPLLWGGAACDWALLFREKYKQRPITPPPRFV